MLTDCPQQAGACVCPVPGEILEHVEHHGYGIKSVADRVDLECYRVSATASQEELIRLRVFTGRDNGAQVPHLPAEA